GQNMTIPFSHGQKSGSQQKLLDMEKLLLHLPNWSNACHEI
ncbi:MAG: hypothetical protein ACJAX8_001923, partial [Flavobacteriales bacterium]